MSTIRSESNLATKYQNLNAQLELMLGYEETLNQQYQEIQELYVSSFLVRRLVPKSDLKRNLGYAKIFNKLFGNRLVSLTGDFCTLERSAHELSSSLSQKSLKDSRDQRLSSVAEEDSESSFPNAGTHFRSLSHLMKAEAGYTQEEPIDIDTAKKNMQSWKKSYSLFLKALPVFASSNPDYHKREKDLLTKATLSITCMSGDIDPGYGAFARLRMDEHNMWIETYRSLANLEDCAKRGAYTYVSRPIIRATGWTKAQASTLSRRQVAVAASMAITVIAAITWHATSENADEASELP